MWKHIAWRYATIVMGLLSALCGGCAGPTGCAVDEDEPLGANAGRPINLNEMVWVTKHNVCDDPKYGSFGRDVVLFYSRQTGEQVQGVDLLVYQDFSEGLVLAYRKYNGKSGYVDVTGRVVIPFQYDLAGLFHEGRADAYIKDCRDKYHAGLIDRRGKWIVPPKRYEKLGYFNEGRCAFRVGDRWGFLDASGKVVIEPQFRRPDLSSRFQIYHEAPIFHEGVAAVHDKDDHVSYIDRYGRPATIKLPEGTRDIGDFHGGLAAFAVRDPKEPKDSVYPKELYGFISVAGNIVAKPVYRSATNFSEGLAAVSLNTDEGFQSRDDSSLALRWDEKGAWGYIDVTGEVVIPFQYPMVGRFSEGLARVFVTDKGWGFIDKTGKFVIPPRDWWVGDFHNGLAEMHENGIIKYIDRAGKVIITTDVKRAIF